MQNILLVKRCIASETKNLSNVILVKRPYSECIICETMRLRNLLQKNRDSFINYYTISDEI